MTKSKPVIFILLILALFLIFYIIINNAFQKRKEYTILTMDEFGICFMVGEDLDFKINEHGFKYSGKKNHGEFTFTRNGLMAEANKVDINGFPAAYTKEKNLRTYQYLLSENGDVLTDRFVYAKKTPLNLVPYREACNTIKKNNPKHIPLKITPAS